MVPNADATSNYWGDFSAAKKRAGAERTLVAVAGECVGVRVWDLSGPPAASADGGIASAGGLGRMAASRRGLGGVGSAEFRNCDASAPD